MPARSRLAVIGAGILAAVFLAWPGFSIDRSGDWRRVLAGFQLQRETGAFIGGSDGLIHLHGLDGRSGRVSFRLAPRTPEERLTLELVAPSGKQQIEVAAGPTNVNTPFPGVADLELSLRTASTNPRPLLLSNLRVDRDADVASICRSLLPLLLGFLGLAGFRRWERSLPAVAASIFLLAAATFSVLVAFDPARASTFPIALMKWTPLALAVGFGLLGICGRGPFSAAVALIGVTLSLHISTVHSGFVYDDRLWARPWTASEVASTFAGSEDPKRISGEQYRPIPSVSHAIDHALWGANSAAFHTTNMTLHALCAFLLLRLLERLKAPRAPAFVGALVLAIHPMAASSIGWISERTDTLADIFIIATLFVFLGPYGSRTLRVLGVALLALWSKETAVMLPVIASLFAVAVLDRQEARARLASLRALFAFVVLYVAVWVSLFPEKTVGRVQATAASLQSHEGGWTVLFGNLFSQLLNPIGFEVWRGTRDSLPVDLWAGLTALIVLATASLSFIDKSRAVGWRLVALGLVYSALVVVPFRGHDAVDVYRLGHSPTVGFALALAGLATLVGRDSLVRSAVLGSALIVGLGPMATETSAAWGYPGFQFRMALRFNLENPVFLGGLTPQMRADLEHESRFESHRDDPLAHPFER